MPRYHFNIRDGQTDIDVEGTELEGLADARREAIRLATDVLHQSAPTIGPEASWCLEVADPAGTVLLTLIFTLSKGS